MKAAAAFAGILILGLSMVSLPHATARPAPDPLLEGFRNPPPPARPRVWWHWMNGNVTEDGIAKDLAWMQRIGIGGLQNFDASLMTPQVVSERLVYMSPEWKRAFRFAAAQAEAQGLELGIAGSPGWSETGGPWVSPEDAIKKVSWSETLIPGGRRFNGRLPQPPMTTGPYQSLAAEGALGLSREGEGPPQVFHDIAVLAVPIENADVDAPNEVTVTDGSGRPLDPAPLSDGHLGTFVELGGGTSSPPPALTLSYAKPRQIRSATLFLRDAHPPFSNPRFTPVLEARIDGSWRRLAAFEITTVPTTVAFAPVRAKEFRVVFGPYAGPERPAQTAPAPGVITPAFIAPGAEPAPAKVAELRLSDEVRIDRFEVKAGFALVNDYHALTTSAAEDEHGPDVGRVIDLTDRMTRAGALDWTPPAGTWRVFRLGWTLTGKTNHPAAPEATGLEVDKLDGEAVARYLRHYLDLYRETAGPDLFGARGVRVLLLDSTEVGAFNWTPRLIEHFRRLRGYDPTPWLPTLTGVVVGSRRQSDQFLYDFRRTLAELHATEHYATVTRIAHEYGLQVYSEALEDQRPVFGDDLSMRRYADVPMAALWTWSDEHGPRPTLLGDMKGASSVAHLYGRRIVAAESLTSALSPWADAPANLRRVVDLAFAHGINRPVIHTSVHQPLDDMQPGLSLMIFGQFFNRHETWAELARPWIDYISRASFLLQQGENVADVAYFYGEEAPITAITAFGAPADLPRRYAYDYVNSEALTQALTLRDGDLVSASGARYRVLYLGPGAKRMTLPTLRRIAAMAADGATVVGTAPVSSPSLADDAAEYARLVERLWSGEPVTTVGKGRVVATQDVEAAMDHLGLVPDVAIDDSAAADDILFVHRRLDDGDVYFLVNRADRPLEVEARFRVSGKAAEFWRADGGTVAPASYRQDGAVTAVPLELEPRQSLFVVFRTDSTAPSRRVEPSRPVPVMDISGPWTVSFQTGRGAPASVALDALRSLSEHPDPGVRYFSGEAVYTTRFTLTDGVDPQRRLALDLGRVGDLAAVTLNGQHLGIAWESPYRVDLRGAVRTGENVLEIKVANLWVNRLIGDAQPGADRIAFTTFPTFRPDAPLRPSGLIGPVRVLAGEPGREEDQ